jgi:putative oxygen-independent coproporphyrinogen III oxidase
MTSSPSRRDLQTFGVYLHVPFCAHRCDYCAFATWTDRAHLVDDYLQALTREIATAREVGLVPATSVFVGGGTPSLVAPEALAAVLDGIPRTPDAEMTVECNPETVTAGHVEAYRSVGVNRLSLGVQSMVPSVLDALGRRHDPTTVARAVDLARSGGVDNLNLDVIYGGAGETLEQWRTTLQEVIELEPDHVSAYALTVEAGTPLADDPVRHPDDDDQAAKYVLATEMLGAAGYEWYEISNWARPGKRCRHNLLYWAQGDYRGFGCAAHSHEQGRRWWNVRTPERYIDAVRAGRSPEGGAESLDVGERRVEALQLAVRTVDGVPDDALAPDDLELLGDLVERVDERIVLTPAGRLLANEVSVRLR